MDYSGLLHLPTRRRRRTAALTQQSVAPMRRSPSQHVGNADVQSRAERGQLRPDHLLERHESMSALEWYEARLRT
jgi:hypothetical protein